MIIRFLFTREAPWWLFLNKLAWPFLQWKICVINGQAYLFSCLSLLSGFFQFWTKANLFHLQIILKTLNLNWSPPIKFKWRNFDTNNWIIYFLRIIRWPHFWASSSLCGVSSSWPIFRLSLSFPGNGTDG